MLDGPVNVVAPEVVSQAVFAKSNAQACRRVVRLRVPASLIRGLAGEAATLLLDGQAAAPRALLAAGFRFKHLTLRSALADLTGTSAGRSDHSAIGRHSILRVE